MMNVQYYVCTVWCDKYELNENECNENMIANTVTVAGARQMKTRVDC